MADVSSCAFHSCSSQESLSETSQGVAETLEEHLIDSGRLQEYAVHLDERGLSCAVDTIHLFHHGLMNYRSFPPKFWKKIRTSNLLERVQKELKPRSRKIGAFPNGASLLDSPVRALSISMRNGLRVTGFFCEE